MVRWKSLVLRMIAILILGTLLFLLGIHLWSLGPTVERFGPCTGYPIQSCVAVGGGDPPRHIAITAVLGAIWVTTSFFIIRNRGHRISSNGSNRWVRR